MFDKQKHQCKYKFMAGGYGKRPLWQWILIYVVIGGIVYAGIYYFFMSKNGGYNYGSSQSEPYNYGK